MVYLLVKGDIPSEKNKKMLEAILVSFCDHGVTPPSTQSARLMASAGSPVNACIAGGILAFGRESCRSYRENYAKSSRSG